MLFDVKFNTNTGRFEVKFDDTVVIDFPKSEESRAGALCEKLDEVFDEFVLVEFEADDNDEDMDNL